MSNTSFFPLLPLLTRWVGELIGSFEIAGLLVVNVSFLIALVLLFDMVREEFDLKAAQKTILYICMFPSAFTLSMFYSDSLLLALIVASFYFGRKDQWLLAALFGLLASMTRLVGVCLAPGLLLMYLEKLNFNLRRIRYVDIGYIVSAPPLGLCMFMLILYKSTGDPIAFLHNYEDLNKHLSLPWTTLIYSLQWGRALWNTQNRPVFGYNAVIYLDIFMGCLFACLIPVLFKRLKLSYAVFSTLCVLVPFLGGRLFAMSRYVSTIFPFFILFGIWGSRNIYFDLGYIILAVPLFGYFLSLFVNHQMCF